MVSTFTMLTMDLREDKNAIKRFLAIFSGSSSSLTLLIPQQAGFRPGKSCCSQVLNLTQHIEDGFEFGQITAAAFVDLTAAYDTINHRRLRAKLVMLTDDVQLTKFIRTMLSNRRFKVEQSRWRNQRNGLPQGSVLSPLLFNVYINDRPLPVATNSFIYADDLPFQWPPTVSYTPTTCALPRNRRRSYRCRLPSPAD